MTSTAREGTNTEIRDTVTVTLDIVSWVMTSSFSYDPLSIHSKTVLRCLLVKCVRCQRLRRNILSITCTTKYRLATILLYRLQSIQLVHWQRNFHSHRQSPCEESWVGKIDVADRRWDQPGQNYVGLQYDARYDGANPCNPYILSISSWRSTNCLLKNRGYI